MLGLLTGHSTIWRPIIFRAVIQALQPTDTGTLVATGAAVGGTGGTGAGANWRRTADATVRPAWR